MREARALLVTRVVGQYPRQSEALKSISIDRIGPPNLLLPGTSGPVSTP
jgi:hypothetical protein